jgi:hypothetical protein
MMLPFPGSSHKPKQGLEICTLEEVLFRELHRPGLASADSFLSIFTFACQELTADAEISWFGGGLSWPEH